MLYDSPQKLSALNQSATPKVVGKKQLDSDYKVLTPSHEKPENCKRNFSNSLFKSFDQTCTWENREFNEALNKFHVKPEICRNSIPPEDTK